jgi:hypothetical protein
MSDKTLSDAVRMLRYAIPLNGQIHDPDTAMKAVVLAIETHTLAVIAEKARLSLEIPTPAGEERFHCARCGLGVAADNLDRCEKCGLDCSVVRIIKRASADDAPMPPTSGKKDPTTTPARGPEEAGPERASSGLICTCVVDHLSHPTFGSVTYSVSCPLHHQIAGKRLTIGSHAHGSMAPCEPPCPMATPGPGNPKPRIDT